MGKEAIQDARIVSPRKTTVLPRIKRIAPADLWDALGRGFADFRAMPTHLVFLGLVYTIAGLVLARLVVGYDVLQLLFPLIAGFALVGPLAAIGIYELSRRRERGFGVHFGHAFAILKSPRRGAILTVGIIMLALFALWIDAAQWIYQNLFGDTLPASVGDFANQLLTTSTGWTLILVGNAVGLVFAVIAMSLSVVSFPLLLDRPVDALSAVVTSVRAVCANPGTMALWGLIVGGTLFLGALPFFVGLAVVVPVLGHATWHLYRKLVPR
jgi:uncharacterized membrane protein